MVIFLSFGVMEGRISRAERGTLRERKECFRRYSATLASFSFGSCRAREHCAEIGHPLSVYRRADARSVERFSRPTDRKSTLTCEPYSRTRDI
ncbi:hypothetical protein GTNG_3190 [Geobacillus thermodenitrificans NG80-2]|uniref:Uncharacterized protein n=1 Tax=Geobacillus thermodenitrificans (strain NG80-2) TaxID=420246 RepID=A4IT81_GEOTN|nr:hypothetical protein GTNG_3190 [Geobacillus thermodenitrificans NG80-2]